MNKICLPPKRFEDDSDPKYDQIRHLSWYWMLRERREKIPMLKAAYQAMETTSITQKKAAQEFGVDPRELREYEGFVEGIKKNLTEASRMVYQHILDEAYESYCGSNGEKNFIVYIDEISGFYGANGRYVRELFEVEKSFYPTNYIP